MILMIMITLVIQGLWCANESACVCILCEIDILYCGRGLLIRALESLPGCSVVNPVHYSMV